MASSPAAILSKGPGTVFGPLYCVKEHRRRSESTSGPAIFAFSTAIKKGFGVEGRRRDAINAPIERKNMRLQSGGGVGGDNVSPSLAPSLSLPQAQNRRGRSRVVAVAAATAATAIVRGDPYCARASFCGCQKGAFME